MKSNNFMVRKYLAEMFGTFTLTLLVSLSLTGSFPIATPALAGFVLAMFVYTIGSISGSHINPAVTIGLWFRKKISTNDSIYYIIFQILGAVFAMLINQYYIGSTPNLIAGSAINPMVIVAEAFGMMVFTFGISAVVDEKVSPAASGLVVGGSLFLGILIASVGSNGVLNPAVALGIGSFSLSYVLGPIIGSIIGFTLYQELNEKK